MSGHHEANRRSRSRPDPLYDPSSDGLQPPLPLSEDDGGALVRPFVGLRAARAMLAGGPEPASIPDATARPFLVTSGRIAGDADIPVETQVVVTSEGRGTQQWLTFEYRDIVSLCHEPLAVAEIAARLSLHLGVARVLVSDLADHGIVTTYRTEADTDVDTILRVINGLRLLG